MVDHFLSAEPGFRACREFECNNLELLWPRKRQGSSLYKYLVCVYTPDIVILIETLCNNNKISSLKYLIGFDHHFSVDCIGYSGGIVVLWRHAAHCS